MNARDKMRAKGSISKWCDGIHWYAQVCDTNGNREKKFKFYNDAWRWLLSYVYARNIKG